MGYEVDGPQNLTETGPCFLPLKQQPSKPRVKSVHPTSPIHEQKGEEGLGRLWKTRRVASHPMVMLMRLEGYFGRNP